jgi:hypothetical protein
MRVANVVSASPVYADGWILIQGDPGACATAGTLVRAMRRVPPRESGGSHEPLVLRLSTQGGARSIELQGPALSIQIVARRASCATLARLIGDLVAAVTTREVASEGVTFDRFGAAPGC